MLRESESILPHSLYIASQSFRRWRASRTSRRIPERMWARARDLAEQYGVSRTSRALGLDYVRLKQRVGIREAEREPSFEEHSPFIELQPSLGSGRCSCVLEVSYADGVEVRAKLEGCGERELSALGRVLLGGQA